ncbi:DUF2237 family protein [Chitinimonas sp.]|uniref:DUF2237 family protein n=1 Tax=Chitinimonas sp. TaxID=1934313 RepID=UPI0035B05988
MHQQALNVLGQPLQSCSLQPLTGFYRDGCCNTGPDDRGRHIVCIEATAGFLEFSRQRGNDLSTPRPEYSFPGVKPGERWCLCAERFVEALLAGHAPQVVLTSTHEDVLDRLSLETLVAYALDRP